MDISPDFYCGVVDLCCAEEVHIATDSNIDGDP